MTRRVREVSLKERIGSKEVKGKVYKYTYYTLPLNLYIPKEMVVKHGTEYILKLDTEEGKIVIEPKRVTRTR